MAATTKKATLSEVETSQAQSSRTSNQRYSQEQLLLAARLLESKPDNIHFAVHAANLKQAISSGPRPYPSSLRFIDGAIYWKNQCADNLDEIQNLKARISILEHEALQRTIDAGTAHDSNNRRSSDNGVHSHPLRYSPQDVVNTRKRIRIDEPDEDRPFTLSAEDPFVHNFDENSLQKLSSYIYKVRICRKQLAELPSTPTTVNEIQKCSSAIIAVITSVIRFLRGICHAVCFLEDDLTSKRGQVFSKAMDQIILAVISCFDAFDNICRTILGRNEKGPLIYQISKFFRECMELLHDLSARQSRHEQKAYQHASRTKKPRKEHTEYLSNNQLCRVMSTTVYNMSWKPRIQAHGELLEGILYVILNCTARLLSQAVFGEVITDSKNIGHCTESSSINTPHDNIYRGETRHVVQVLHNALGGRDKRELFLEVIASARSISNEKQDTNAVNTPSPGMGLLARVRKILQNTLLHGTLGLVDGELLTSPEAIVDEANDSEEHDGERSEGEWFCEKVWDLIGWDLLV